VNGLEQEWTGVEESDRVLIAGLVRQGGYFVHLIMVCPLSYTATERSKIL
jgi:hypothetical protein